MWVYFFILEYMINETFEMAKTLYKLWEMKEEIWIEYLAEEMARNRTEKWINRM